MKILLLAKKFPFPLKDGESIAINNLAKSLTELGCEISLLAMNTSKHFYANSYWPEELGHFSHLQTVAVDNRIRPLDAFVNLFSADSYHISRFVSPDYERALKRMLQRSSFDIIQLETLYLAPYLPLIRSLSNAPVVMRAHNVEHEIWDRICENTMPGPRKWYLQHLAKKLREYECNRLNDYDLLLPITQRDEARFRKLGRRGAISSVPIGLDASEYRPDYRTYQNPLSISFIGSLDWRPNVEGLNWLLDRVWGAVIRKHPGLKLHIAGRNPPSWLSQLNRKGVQFHGEVARADTFLNAHSLSLVPLLSGSGMRAKILEGMALGKVVLTTSIGLEGIPAQSGQEVIVADTPADFATAIEWCCQNPTQLEAIGRRARQLIEAEFDSTTIARRLLRRYTEMIPVPVS